MSTILSSAHDASANANKVTKKQGELMSHPTTSADVVLSVRNLTMDLPPGMERTHAVKDISFDLHAGEILCIIGESGSGKSITASKQLI
ncbi:hypothetical protein B5M44_15635 [Shinella sumterensis]|nr:hypothetical protein B5M44_15635 [Shinella sumterensis]